MRHPLRGRAVVTTPVLAGAVGLSLSLVPTLLPRPVVVQAVFSAVVVLQLALLGLVGRAVARAASRGRRPSWWPAVATWRAQLSLACIGAGGVLAGALAGQARTVHLLHRMHQSPPPLDRTLLAGALAAGIAVGVAGAVALVVAGARRLVGLLRRSRRARVGLLAPLLALTTTAATVPLALPTASAADRPGIASPGSWGVKGRQFMRGGPDAAAISQVTGRPALRPLRVYAGTDVAHDPARRADLAVDELVRRGGLHRAAVVLVVPTGSGWVDPSAVAAVEYLYGGDVATLAVQYADTPSWVAYLRGTAGARRTAGAALEALHRRVEAVSPADRPQVLVFGESLGAMAGLLSEPDAVTLTARTDGALWVGVPAQARPRALAAAADARQAVLVHADDPVAAWSPQLAVERTPYWHRSWVPGVSFWQAGADLVSAYWTPDGFGHRYSRELVDGWRQAARPDVVGTPPDDRLPAVRDAVGALGAVG